MRSLAAFLLVSLAASLTAAAQGAQNLSLSIKVSGAKVLYGHTVTLSGRLSSGVEGRTIEIDARPVGSRSMLRVATVVTTANGGFRVPLRPAIGTTYQARYGAVVTPELSVGVEPALTTHVLPAGSVTAIVRAGRSLAGRRLELQRALRGRWRTIERATLDTHSQAVFPAPIRAGRATLRVALSVNEAGAGLLGATSHGFVYRAGTASIAFATRSATVLFGRSVELTGRISTGDPGQRVAVWAHPYGKPTVKVATLTTAAGGRFSLRSRPTIETAYTVSWDGLASRPAVVDVRPVLAVRLRANDRVAVAIAPARTFLGRNVELEQAIGSGWRAVAELPLRGPDGAASFALSSAAKGIRIRVAMSVNEAGAGYLGATSRPLAVTTANGVSLTPSSLRVLYGHTVTLSGAVSSGRSGQAVSILARPYGSTAATLGATVVTGTGGRWSFRAAPSIETTYLARWGATESRPVVVGVAPRVTVAVLHTGQIATRVLTTRALSGRLVELQSLDGATGKWTTIARMRLDRRASAVFAPPATSAGLTLRVAMSVNQAGAGLLGATSHPFVYRPGAAGV